MKHHPMSLHEQMQSLQNSASTNKLRDNEEANSSVCEQSSSSGSKPATEYSISSSVPQVPKTAVVSLETKVVTYGKRCMLALLMLVTAGAASAVFMYTALEERQEFEHRVSDGLMVYKVVVFVSSLIFSFAGATGYNLLMYSLV